MARNEELFNAIIKGKRKDVAELVQAAVDAGADVEEILMGSMVPAMREIGDRFSRNEAYVPEMLIAARAMQAGLNILETGAISRWRKSPSAPSKATCTTSAKTSSP